MTTKFYSATAAGKILGVRVESVTRWIKKLGMPVEKHRQTYVLTESDIEIIRGHMESSMTSKANRFRSPKLGAGMYTGSQVAKMLGIGHSVVLNWAKKTGVERNQHIGQYVFTDSDVENIKNNMEMSNRSVTIRVNRGNAPERIVAIYSENKMRARKNTAAKARKRALALNVIAASFGFSSWRYFENAVLKRHEQMAIIARAR